MKLNRTYRKLCKIYLQNKRIEEQQKAMKKLIRKSVIPIILLCSVSAHAQIIFEINDKRAEIVPSVTYDTSVCLSLNQMDNIMVQLLQGDSIAAVSIISDLQLLKQTQLISMQFDQINAAKAAISTSNNFNKVLIADIRELTADNEVTKRKLNRNRKGFFAASLVAVLELFLLL